jgi:hypothetical protein
MIRDVGCVFVSLSNRLTVLTTPAENGIGDRYWPRSRSWLAARTRIGDDQTLCHGN